MSGSRISPEQGRNAAWHACVDELVKHGRTRDEAERRANELLANWFPEAKS